MVQRSMMLRSQVGRLLMLGSLATSRIGGFVMDCLNGERKTCCSQFLYIFFYVRIS